MRIDCVAFGLDGMDGLLCPDCFLHVSPDKAKAVPCRYGL